MKGERRYRRLLRLRGSRAGDSVREVDDEVQMHIDLRTSELIAAGMDAASAAAQARRLFARDRRTLNALYAAAIERDEEMRMRERLASIGQDIRYAARSLIRDPLLTGFVVTALALGVGANIASFDLVDRLLLRGPAHVEDAGRVVRLYGEVDFLGRGLRTSSYIPYAAYLQFRELTAFEEAGAYQVGDRLVGEGADARRQRVGQVLGGFFPLLRVQPVVGRLLAASEDAATDGDLAVISHEIWQSRYGADTEVTGRTIVLDGVPHAIVGVTPAGFTGTEPRRVAVWTLGSSATAGTRNWNIVGRLRPGASAEAAGAEATRVHRPATSGPFAWFRDARIFAAPLDHDLDGRLPLEATVARWLAGVTLIILLVTFANVVNLLLVRVARRRRELAIRMSLGSGRARVMRLVAVEGALLALVSGAASLLVARIVEPAVRRALFDDQAGWTFTLLDWRLLAMAGGMVLATALCIGIIPAWQAGDHRLARLLRSGRHSTPASSRIRSSLTVLQAAFSVVLLVGAGLFLRSLAKVNALDLGVDAERVITAEAALPRIAADRHAETERMVYRQLEEAVAQVPGVEHVAVAIGLPLDGGSFSAGVRVPGHDSIPTMPGGGPYVSTVTAAYFDAVGTRIVRGRAFTRVDREGSEPVVIVNETMARALWTNGDALDQCMHFGDATSACSRVVGVAADVHRTGLREQASFQYYIPLGQQSMFGGARLVIRPERGARLTHDALREAIVAAYPPVRAVELGTLSEALSGELRPLRLGIAAFGISSVLALLVAMLGLYSLMSYFVAWRTHEIGVRAALGATRTDIVGLVMRSGVLLGAVGVALGLGLALLAGPWLEPHLFETSARDAAVLAGVAAGILGTAAVAGWLPARRASRISPTEALRAE
jgi:predicted permease